MSKKPQVSKPIRSTMDVTALDRRGRVWMQWHDVVEWLVRGAQLTLWRRSGAEVVALTPEVLGLYDNGPERYRAA